MAEHWLKALGSKLLDTGAAYLQQVKLVQELRALPPAQARERFLQFVQALTPAARAGFSLTLTSLANNERQAEAKRFLETLRAALLNPASWSSGANALPAVAPAPAPKPAAASADPFDDDLRRMDEWLALSDEARPRAVEAHVRSLPDPGLATFRAHLETARSNVEERIKDHRDNEARIAAGRYVEDQMSYNLSRLAGGPHDPGWLSTLNDYERVLRLVDATHRRVLAVQEERRKPPPRPTPAPAPTPSPTRARKVQPARKEAPAPAAGLSPQVQALRQMLEQELAAGRVPAERAPAYRRTLDKIESLCVASERGEIGPDVAETRMQEAIADFMRYVADPGNTSARATPRGRAVLRHVGALKASVLHLAKNHPPAATAQALGTVLGDLTAVQTEAAQARDDGQLAQIEARSLRPAARAWHELTLTRHATLARPLWECKELTRAENTLFYAGAADLQARLERVAARKQLQVDNLHRLQNHGQLRWDALGSSHVAVFDLRRAGEISELAPHAPKRARELTAAAYELGLAFALGKPVLVLCGPADTLPFDIDLSPLRLEGGDADDDSLANALDETFYVAQRESRGNSIPATLAELDRLTQGHTRHASIEGMGWLDPALKRDPAGFAAAARQLLREIDQPQWHLLRPAWPGAYPDPAQPRCFHVMPFGPDWADAVRDTARAASAAAGMAYRRGDEAEEGRIVHAIWDDLCRASVVLVELNGGNLNVMIELGMAHALGRPVLAVQRAGGHDLRPPHIEKLRVHRYDDEAALAAILRARLQA
ncbi:MAG TPA: hypothetical protein VIW70_17775 [Rubrivivax sp.]